MMNENNVFAGIPASEKIKPGPNPFEKLFNWFRSNLLDVLLFLFCAIYILRALADITESDKTIYEILADGAVALIGNYLVKRLMAKKGILKGLVSPKFIAKTNAYGQKKEEIAPFVEELHPFCDKFNASRLKQKQAEFLLKYAMTYTNFAKGVYNYDPKKKKIADECRKIKIFEYTPEMLTNAYDNATSDAEIMTATIRKYESKQWFWDLVLSIMFAILFGYFTVQTVKDFNFGLLVWYSIQVGFFLLNGKIKQDSAYYFVTEVLRGKIDRAITIIDSFINIRNKNPGIFKVDLELIEEKTDEAEKDMHSVTTAPHNFTS